jgi:hypothetical protein
VSIVSPLINQCARIEYRLWAAEERESACSLGTVPNSDACCGSLGQDMMCVLTRTDAGSRLVMDDTWSVCRRHSRHGSEQATFG